MLLLSGFIVAAGRLAVVLSLGWRDGAVATAAGAADVLAVSVGVLPMVNFQGAAIAAPSPLISVLSGAATAVVRCHMLPDALVADREKAFVAGGVGGTLEAFACGAVHA